MLLVLTDVSTTWAEDIIRVMMMASTQVVETSVNTNNSPSQDYTTNPDDHSSHNKIMFVIQLRPETENRVWKSSNF